MHAVANFVAFLLGWFAHAWDKANGTIRSPKSGIRTYAQYIELRAPVLVIRFLASSALLMLWNEHLMGALKFPIPSWFPQWILSFPITPGTSLAFGLCSDVVLNAIITRFAKKFPSLEKDIPIAVPEQPQEARP